MLENAPVVMFFRGYGSKNRLKCSRGFALPCYTPSVEGSAQAREQKVAKMLPPLVFLTSMAEVSLVVLLVGSVGCRFLTAIAVKLKRVTKF